MKGLRTKVNYWKMIEVVYRYALRIQYIEREEKGKKKISPQVNKFLIRCMLLVLHRSD